MTCVNESVWGLKMGNYDMQINGFKGDYIQLDTSRPCGILTMPYTYCLYAQRKLRNEFTIIFGDGEIGTTSTDCLININEKNGKAIKVQGIIAKVSKGTRRRGIAIQGGTSRIKCKVCDF